MDMKNGVMVILEHNRGNLLDVSIELTSKARDLADTLKVNVGGIFIGSQNDFELVDKTKLHEIGMDKIYTVFDNRVTHFLSLPYSKAISKIVSDTKVSIVLFGATTNGRDVAPRVASELKCGLTADCTELQIGDHKTKEKEFKNILLQIRPAFGGNIIATIISPESFPSMATVREGVMKINHRVITEETPKLEIAPYPIDFTENDFLSEIIEIITKEKSVDLKKAKIIVAAGMGAADHESISLLKTFAHTVGGELGASRPIIDAGLLSRDHQVGQTGVTVRPNLYVACGISGQIQHCAGMQESKRILAINRDPNAPIFKVAHYGIVGEVKDVLPKLISAYKEK